MVTNYPCRNASYTIPQKKSLNYAKQGKRIRVSSHAFDQN